MARVAQVEDPLQREVDVAEEGTPGAATVRAHLDGDDPRAVGHTLVATGEFEPAAMLATCVPCSQWRVTGVYVQLSAALPPIWDVSPLGQSDPAEKQAWSTIFPAKALCWLSTPESRIATS